MLQSALLPGSGSSLPGGDGGGEDGESRGVLNFFSCCSQLGF